MTQDVHDLISRIEAFLRRHDMPETTFGRKAVADPGFVRGVRSGREPRRSTERRVLEFMDSMDANGGGDLSHAIGNSVQTGGFSTGKTVAQSRGVAA